jgi:O-antigen ligase
MSQDAAEKTIARYLIVGIPLASAFLWASGTTDPVNVTKLFITGGVGGAVGFTAIIFLWRRIWVNFRVPVVAILIFLAAMINSLVLGQGPFLQTYYGVYGRQTGFIAYLFLTLILFATLGIQRRDFFPKILWGLIAVGLLNIIYCAWVLAFGDFLPWNNIYKSILGLFGNPDFISAFLGIFIVVCASVFLAQEISNKFRVFLLMSSLLALYEIVMSKAIQGLVVTFGGLALVGFFWIRSRSKSWYPTGIYSLVFSGLGVLATLGALQTGPLSFIYKRSVSLRGSYWHAGIEMGQKYPISGVGFDGYGDFYRQARPPVALIDLPGVQVITNASHNVYLDFFAFGGWPLLLSYLTLNLIVGYAIVKHLIGNRLYDSTFVGLTSAWACYNVQSIISINQIGLAIWGWILSGAILSYTLMSRENAAAELANPLSEVKSKQKAQLKQNIISPGLVAGVSCLIGLFLSFPPLGSDIKWKSALDSRSLTQVEASLSDSFINPVPSSRFMQAYQIFQNSNLPEFALKYARVITKTNPNYFEGWKALYLLPNSTQGEKLEAKKNLMRLDPLNPNVLSTAP